jgi:hypothetical protein
MRHQKMKKRNGMVFMAEIPMQLPLDRIPHHPGLLDGARSLKLSSHDSRAPSGIAAMLSKLLQV